VLVGWLNSGSAQGSGHLLVAFKEALAALGWKEGEQVTFEIRWAEGRIDRLQSMATELAEKRAAIIVAGQLQAVRAATKAAPRTPIVMTTGSDPVATGLVTSLAHPGGMITGLTNQMVDISEKYVELLLEAMPQLQRVGFLADSTTLARTTYMETARRSAKQSSIDVRFAEARNVQEVEAALSRFAQERVQALVLFPGPSLGADRRRIVELALAHRWPLMGFSREWAKEGALLTYGPDFVTNNRRAAFYVDSILKGANPGDLPIEQPTKFELVVNLKTANTLGITMPQSLRARADELIQ